VVVEEEEGRVRDEQATGMVLLHNSNTARTTRRRWDGDAAIVGKRPSDEEEMCVAG
jgi:hypothetical protein